MESNMLPIHSLTNPLMWKTGKKNWLGKYWNYDTWNKNIQMNLDKIDNLELPGPKIPF